MEKDASSVPLDERLQRLLEGFAIDPTDVPAFKTLEESLFLAGAWSQLAGVYECRLVTLAKDSAEKSILLLRLAHLLEERLGDRLGAQRRYEELLAISPQHGEGLASLRRLHVRAGELTAALQVAEIEEARQLPAKEAAQLRAEIGELWLQMGDVAEAGKRFMEALDLDPLCDAALEGRAQLAERDGRRNEAVRLLERRLDRLQGAARIGAMEHLVDLLPENQKDRKRALLREVVREAPETRTALEKLIVLELDRESWTRVDELQRRLWKLKDPRGQLRLAQEATRLHLDGENTEAALYWAERLDEVAGSDLAVQELRARVLRAAGQTTALARVLERSLELNGRTPELCRELATIYEASGRAPEAIELLKRDLNSQPEDLEGLELLDRCYEKLGRHAERADTLHRRVELTEDSVDAARLGSTLGDLRERQLRDSAGAEQAYRGALARLPGCPDAGQRLSQLLRGSGRVEELTAFLEGFADEVASGRERAGIWCEIGAIRADREEDTERARAAYIQAFEGDPRSRLAVQGLRDLGQARRDDSVLLEACERELAFDPDVERAVELLLELITVSRRSGDLPRARSAAERWVELQPSGPSLRMLTEISHEVGDSAAERAGLEVLESLLVDEPRERAGVRAELAELALRQADPDALEIAAHWFRESLALEADSKVRARLIELHRRAGQQAELVHELRAAVKQARGEDLPPLQLELSRTLAELGDFTRAISTLLPSFEQDPGQSEIGDLLEQLLLEHGRIDTLSDVLGRRLVVEKDEVRRRDLAHRRADLLLDVLDRPADALAVLRKIAQPQRSDMLETLYSRALESAGNTGEHEAWLQKREAHLDGSERVDLLLRLASLQEQSGREPDALLTLQRAQSVAPTDQRERVRKPLLALLRQRGEPDDQLRHLKSFIDDEADPTLRALFRRERARILAETMEQPAAALDDLEAAQSDAPLGVEDLRLLASLYRRVDNPTRLASALDLLAQASTAPDEIGRALRELVTLHLEGPEETRDPRLAERLLHQLIELDPADDGAFDRLVSLLAAQSRTEDVAAALELRLRSEALSLETRTDLSLRLARIQADFSQFEGAAATLQRAREQGARSPAVDELLFTQLEASSDVRARVELCREQARTSAGIERERWLRRWLAALSATGEPSEEQLEIVEQLLLESPNDAEIMALRLPFLRRLGRVGTLAEALEGLLEQRASLSDGQRRLYSQELLRLYEGPLENPESALALIEREVENDPTLRARGVRIAALIDDPAREVSLLSPLVLDAPVEAPAPPEWVRRLSLALVRTGELERAVPLLWRSLEANPRDQEVLSALEGRLRHESDTPGLLRLLESHFPIAASDTRAQIAREGFTLAEQAGEPTASLRWARRWEALESLLPPECQRWLELEQSVGDSAGTLRALSALGVRAKDPMEQAHLMAAEASIHAERGELELARKQFEAALQCAPEPPLAWFDSLERVLATLGHTERRLELLERLAEHPEVEHGLRAKVLETRIALLASQPELRSQAACELRTLIEGEADANPTLQTKRMRRLLDLYDEIDQPSDWCETAAALLPLVPEPEKRTLERELARRLTLTLSARDRAIARWEEILERDPGDAEALKELTELLRVSGMEAKRAEVLERYARTGPEGSERFLLEAARLRWHSLRDAEQALADLDAVLETAPSLCEAHELRCEVCAYLRLDENEMQSLQVLLASGADGHESAQRWLRLGRLLAAGGGRITETIEAAHKALARAPESSELRREARLLLENAGAWEEASTLLQQDLSAAEPTERPELLRRLARIRWDELRDAAGACGFLEQLAELENPNAEDRQRWADTLTSLERWPEVVQQRRFALEGLGEMAPAGGWLELAELIMQHSNDPIGARDACSRALERDSRLKDALKIRSDLNESLGNHRFELEDRIRLAELLPLGPEAAGLRARAAILARDQLGDDVQAWMLFRSALQADSSCVPALLGAGRISLDRGEWSEAERMFGLACSLLRDGDEPDEIADAARLAAQAALQQDRFGEAFRHLEFALEREPEHPGALDEMAGLALRLGAQDRARRCCELRLTQDLTKLERIRHLVQLAEACSQAGDSAPAAKALEEAVELDPNDPAVRSRCLDLLEELGEGRRAVTQIEAWLEQIPAEQRPELVLRAAKLEAASGDLSRARARLEGHLERSPEFAAAWCELARMVAVDEGPAATLGVAERALRHLQEESERSELYWIEAEALYDLGRIAEAVGRAFETLAGDASNLDAARMLARNLGRAGDFLRAVRQLERTLSEGQPPPAIEAELWEAVGRAYAGPLEDIMRAERCYERALDANPLRTSAREALADITAFDPARHRDSLRQHRDLLEAFPARVNSWRALGRISDHRRLEELAQTCDGVLEGLGELRLNPAGEENQPLIVSLGAPTNPLVCGATELLLTMNRSGELPMPTGSMPIGPLSDPIAEAIQCLAATSWGLSDDTLRAIWSHPFDGESTDSPDVSRKTRRRLRRALRGFDLAELGGLEPDVWREELLAHATAIAVGEGALPLGEALLQLMELWPATARLDLRSGGDRGAALQLCPPARILLLRIADAVIEGIGLG